MRRHWMYLKSVLRHKWYVFLACLQFRVPLWSAILHDWDKRAAIAAAHRRMNCIERGVCSLSLSLYIYYI
jgi:hypothetical protein